MGKLVGLHGALEDWRKKEWPHLPLALALWITIFGTAGRVLASWTAAGTSLVVSNRSWYGAWTATSIIASSWVVSMLSTVFLHDLVDPANIAAGSPAWGHAIFWFQPVEWVVLALVGRQLSGTSSRYRSWGLFLTAPLLYALWLSVAFVWIGSVHVSSAATIRFAAWAMLLKALAAGGGVLWIRAVEGLGSPSASPDRWTWVSRLADLLQIVGFVVGGIAFVLGISKVDELVTMWRKGTLLMNGRDAPLYMQMPMRSGG